MNTNQTLAIQYRYTSHTFQANLKDLTDTEALIAPGGGGGHKVAAV